MKIGVIGYGKRMRHMIDMLVHCDPDVRLVAVTDIKIDEVKGEVASRGWTHDIAYYSDASDMLRASELDGICIGTRCNLHAEMASLVIKTGLPLFLEKPVAIHLDELVELRQTYMKYAGTTNNIVVSFPLRLTEHVQLAKEIIGSGKIGTVEHVQAINNVPYGPGYFQKWFRDEALTGGLWLQKATHDFDYINSILDLRPVQISAMTSKQIFKGDKPVGLVCKDCDERETCPESDLNLVRYANEARRGPGCSFAVDTGLEDSGSAMILYESGMHAVYSQNFYTRKSAGTRSARFIGYKGTLEFDFRMNEIKVHMHHSGRIESYMLQHDDSGHSGGDARLAQNFIDILKGKAESTSPMEAGLLSALMCIKAKESAETHTFQSISWD